MKEFFGYMMPGYDIPRALMFKDMIDFGTLRMWNVGSEVPHLLNTTLENPWDGFDYAIALATQRGATPMFVFGDDRGVLPPPVVWNDLCFRVANRGYGIIKYYEMWNEPAVTNGSDVDAILTMARTGGRVIRTADSTAKILTPSLNDLNKDYGATFAELFLSAARSSFREFDGIAFHSYDGDANGVMSALSVLQRLVKKYKINLPIYLTEFALVGRDDAATIENMLEAFHWLSEADVRIAVWNGQEQGAQGFDRTRGLGKSWQTMYDATATQRQGCLRKIWPF